MIVSIATDLPGAGACAGYENRPGEGQSQSWPWAGRVTKLSATHLKPVSYNPASPSRNIDIGPAM